MHKYSVYHHPETGWEAFKHGFSWPGFFFDVIQLSIVNLYGISALIVLGALIIYYFFPNELLIIVLGFVIKAIIGVHVNEWRRDKLSKYYVRTIEVRKPIDAILIVLGKREERIFQILSKKLGRKPTNEDTQKGKWNGLGLDIVNNIESE